MLYVLSLLWALGDCSATSRVTLAIAPHLLTCTLSCCECEKWLDKPAGVAPVADMAEREVSLWCLSHYGACHRHHVCINLSTPSSAKPMTHPSWDGFHPFQCVWASYKFIGLSDICLFKISIPSCVSFGNLCSSRGLSISPNC